MTKMMRHWLTRGISGPSRVRTTKTFAAIVVKLDRLGDFVLSLSALHRVFERFGETNCLLVVSPVAAELAALKFPRVSRLVMPFGLGHGQSFLAALRFRRLLGRCSTPQTICFRHQRWDYDELVLSWIKTPRCIRTSDEYTRKLRPDRRFYTCDLPGAFVPVDRILTADAAGRKLCRELELHRQVLASTLDRTVDDDEVLPVLPGATIGDGIVVSPFGSEAIRDFPPQLIRTALTTIRAQFGAGCRVVLLGQPRQRDRILAMAKNLALESNLSVKLQLSLADYMDAVSSAAFVLTADTATAHLATAADRRTIVTLGGGHYGQFGPWSRSLRQQWLTKKVDCFGCDWKCPHPEPYCLTQIDNDALTRAIAVISSA